MSGQVLDEQCTAPAEGAYAVRTLTDEAARRQAFALRHKVFAERLHWVPCTPEGLERDGYDDTAVVLGLVDGEERIVGVARLVLASGPFMLEREFRCLITEGHVVRKEPDTIEITRLAIDPEAGDKGLSSALMLELFKGIYHWCTAHDVRYCYMEVEPRFLRVLRLIGFPCQALCRPMRIPPAHAVSVAARLDWDEFREEAALRRPDFLAWMMEGQSERRTWRARSRPRQADVGRPEEGENREAGALAEGAAA